MKNVSEDEEFGEVKEAASANEQEDKQTLYRERLEFGTNRGKQGERIQLFLFGFFALPGLGLLYWSFHSFPLKCI